MVETPCPESAVTRFRNELLVGVDALFTDFLADLVVDLVELSS
jgi:hypothetical protein